MSFPASTVAKRALLREYQLEIIATASGRRKHRLLKVERIRFAGLPPDVWLYKKMKRLGIA